MQLLQLTIIFCLIVLSACHYRHKDHHHHHPKYQFDYGVKDAISGDYKTHWETRDGNVVKGEYTIHEADGTRRIVKYVADHHGGFHSHVQRVGYAVHPHHGESYANIRHY